MAESGTSTKTGTIQQNKKKVNIITSAITIVVLVILNFLYFIFTPPVQMSGSSMSPTYVNRAYLFTTAMINKSKLEHSDKIVFETPTDPKRDSLKRVIGISGDRVILDGGRIFLNGQVLHEVYVPQGARTFGGEFMQEGESVTVPPESYFVLGDNRPESRDSREFGFVAKDSVISKVLFCYWNCK